MHYMHDALACSASWAQSTDRDRDLMPILSGVIDWFHLNITTMWPCSQSEVPSLQFLPHQAADMSLYLRYNCFITKPYNGKYVLRFHLNNYSIHNNSSPRWSIHLQYICIWIIQGHSPTRISFFLLGCTPVWNHEILWLNAIVYTVSNPLTCLHMYWQPLHAPEG